jgi:hypothetical protein
MSVPEVQLDKCRPCRDFGKGFYLTIYKEQAIHMALRVVRLYGGYPAVSIYEYDDVAANGLNILRFEAPTVEWAQFVMNNRNKSFDNYASPACNHDSKYDIVVGPIANDDMVLLFRQYTDRLISLDILAKNLEFRNLTNQYSFHTNRAIRLLNYKGIINE